MDYLYFSVIGFNIATFGFLLASVILTVYLSTKKEILLKVFKFLGASAAIAHTFALIFRWMQAGFDRPPWTNLYESLVFFSWGMGVLTTYVIFKYRTYFLATILYPITFAGLGLASLVTDKSITPLVPALQSNWIKIHVFTATLAYPGFIIASVISLFYLLKNKTHLSSLNIGFVLLGLFSLLTVGGENVFVNGVYEIPKTIMQNGIWVKVPVDPTAEKIEWIQVMVPYAAKLFLASAILYLFSLISSIASIKDKTNEMWEKSFKFLNIAGTISFGLLIANIYYNLLNRSDMSEKSNPYQMAILALTFGVNVFFLIFMWKKETFERLLPKAQWLDEFAYKVTLFAFPFMTLLLITGAIWAYSAWGRYWGWDPKETCALITWLIFAAYLHSRKYFGSKGGPAAVISIIGGISVFFTFLGANLLLSGLHSYGAQ